MKWILALDVRPGAQGAVGFAQWLVRTSIDCNVKTVGADDLLGVHVVDRSDLDLYLREEPAERFRARAGDAVQRALKSAEAGDLVERIEIAVDKDEVEHLLRARQEEEADGIVVAQARATGQRPRTHLGPAVHRLLRSHAAPVVVVQHDLSAGQLGDGPVVMATELEESSAEAGRFAVRFAAEHGKTLVFCHAVPDPEETLAAYEPGKEIDKTAAEHRTKAKEKFAKWCDASGIEAGELRIEVGDPVHVAVDVAAELHAPLIVTGTRSKSALERVFIGSVAMDIANTAFCPVAVVPTPE